MSNEELCVLAKGGDTEARNQLLKANLSFIQKQANKIWGQSGSGRIDVDDLIQEVYFGLIEAIGRFDPERGTKFLTYAVWWIRKFIKETVRIILADDGVNLTTLANDEQFEIYEKSPERIVLQAETYPSYIMAWGKSPLGRGPICSTVTVS